MLAITNGKIITDNGILEGSSIIIKDRRIIGVSHETPYNIETIDAKCNYISPGFIDIHIHGAGGYDIMDGTCESINSISNIIAAHGVTSFLPATMTQDQESIRKALRAVRECMNHGTSGANVIGAHLEGPFINEKFKGAHDARYIAFPDVELLSWIVENDFSIIKRVTVAPEIAGATALIKFLTDHGIIVSVGHSGGSYDDIMSSIGLGVSHSTHLYNAMRGFNHREPGVVGAIFDSNISTEIIADGAHIHYAAVRTALAQKGYKNCALASDSMRAACMSDGIYSLGGQNVHVKDGTARLSDGTLAGSTLTLDAAVRNIIRNTGCNIVEAIAMASWVPSRICKIDNFKGHIKPGYDADIIIFDHDINIKTTIIGGKIINQ